MNRRRFTWVATSGLASAALVACSGDAVKDDITPTRIADVEGAPPTLAPNATPFSAEEQGGGGGAAPTSGPITVTGLDSLKFDPSTITAAPGQVIHFVNGGALQHDLNVDELDMKMEPIDGGAEQDLTVPADAAPGDYTYYCSVPGHREAGMEGTLTVAEAGAGGGEEASGGAAAGGGGPITVTGEDSLKFDPSEISAAPGQVIHFVNGGALQHDLNVDELDMKMEPIDGGAEQDLTVPEDAEVGQSYTYYCSVPGHREAGMEGTLTIVEAGGGGGAAGGEEATPEEEAATPEEEAAAAGGGGASEPITVKTEDALKFDPSEISAAPGQEIHVVNEGMMQHDFIIDELGIGTDMLNSGDEQTVTVPDDAEVGQSYTYYCSVPGHREAGMEGTLTIVEGGGGAAAAPPDEAAATESETGTAASAEAAGPVDASQTITVETLDALQFDPSEIAAAPGQTIKVVNNGSLQHDFVIDEWGLATALLGNGQEDEIAVPADAEIGQSFTFYCSVPGHAAAGMQGTLTVAEAAGAEAGAAEEPAEATPEPTEAAAEATPGVTLDPDAIRVAALDSMRFAPSQFSAAPGQQIYLVNPGVLIHDIVVDDWDLDSGALGGGEQTTFNIPDDAEVGAEVEFYCSVPGHKESGMVGTITIVEADVNQEEAVTPVAGASPATEATPAGGVEATPVAETASPAAATGSGGGGEAIEVHTLDALKFDPSEITASPGQEIRVVNEGMMQHDFIIDELEMATDLLNNGDEATVKVPDDAEPGEYTYYCSVPGHQAAGMEGTLTVQ
jgi:plastocyanin